ncbi:hypothetical protein [Yinghuangia seranimata]|uniref:hypothetical protein n=1 Tax=Yinghuangia seranimata TaxID=408067 RepID=UPI00248C7A50|nr:hypothetical protein [Yinghuangia seranimata]MDI2125982.1 hypothetical protein [Yinghuangia seranimata]
MSESLYRPGRGKGFATERTHTDGSRHDWAQLGPGTWQCRECQFRTSRAPSLVDDEAERSL